MHKRKHITWNTVLYSEPAHFYEEVEQEILVFRRIISVCHCPRDVSCTKPIRSWCAIGHRQAVRKSHLSDDVREKRSKSDPEAERRYSLMKLEAFQRKYKEQWLRGEIAPKGSQWHRDNQYSLGWPKHTCEKIKVANMVLHKAAPVPFDNRTLYEKN